MQILERLGPIGAPAQRPAAVAASTFGAGLDRFIELAQAAQTSIDSVTEIGALPAAVNAYLSQARLSPELLIDPMAGLTPDDWEAAGLHCLQRPLPADHAVCVTPAYAGIAEFGCMVLSSKRVAELRSSFLAATHIIVLPADRVLPGLEQFWNLLRREHPDAEAMPREFCFVSGPSRTGDLGLPAKLGAHGPARVHTIIVETSTVP